MPMHTFLTKFNNMDKLVQAAVAISILIPSLFWCIAIFKKSMKEKALLPPGPRGLPILGYLPFLGTNLHREFSELAHRYGPIFKLKLGSKLCVILSSPSLVKEITREHDVIFANRDPPITAMIVSYGGFDIAWAPYGPYWRNMRKVFVREILSGSNLDACYDLRKDEVRKAIEFVSTKVGRSVDIGALAFKTEANVVISMLCGGTDVANQQRKVGDEFREVFAKVLGILSKPNISDFFPMLRRFDIQGIEKEAKALLQKVEEVLDAMINERVKMAGDEIKNAGRKKDFLQILLDLKLQEDTGEEINMTQKKAILMDITVGGTDTTATMTEWVMAEVVHNKEIMEQIQREIEDVVGVNNIIEEFHLSKLHYLEAVVKETFRLHPALPLLVPKRPSQTCLVGGYTVPQDATVFVNAWEIHRDPELWENPLEFRPERFLIEPNKWDYSGNNFQYLPFGSGRRMCPGIPLAEIMVMYIVASLLHSFDWQPTKSKEVDLSDKFSLVMRKTTPLLAIPTKRSHK